MPINPEKYYYINKVGLTQGSWALEQFLADANRHHMQDQPGKLVALRLTEYYEMMERLHAGATPAPIPPANNGNRAVASAPPLKGSAKTFIETDDEDEEATMLPLAQEEGETLEKIADIWDMESS